MILNISLRKKAKAAKIKKKLQLKTGHSGPNFFAHSGSMGL
jgi:hypothetical protein